MVFFITVFESREFIAKRSVAGFSMNNSDSVSVITGARATVFG
jgi:hypothetical protein